MNKDKVAYVCEVTKRGLEVTGELYKVYIVDDDDAKRIYQNLEAGFVMTDTAIYGAVTDVQLDKLNIIETLNETTKA